MRNQGEAQAPSVTPKGNTSRIVLSVLILLCVLAVMVPLFLIGAGMMIYYLEVPPGNFTSMYMSFGQGMLWVVGLLNVGFAALIAWRVVDKGVRILARVGGALAIIGLFTTTARINTMWGGVYVGVVLMMASFACLIIAAGWVLLKSLRQPLVSPGVRIVALTVVALAFLAFGYSVFNTRY